VCIDVVPAALRQDRGPCPDVRLRLVEVDTEAVLVPWPSATSTSR